MNECSKCGKQTNELHVFSCPNCVDKKCPHCGKKRGKERYGLVDPHAQLECSECGHKKNFLHPYGKVCEQCSWKKTMPSQRKCFYLLNNNLSLCDLCGEKLEKPECAYCYCQRFGKVYNDSKSHEHDIPPKKLITAKETRTFHIKLRIKDSDGKVKILSTKQDWEIVWEKGEGKFSKMETGRPAGEEVQIVKFWENSKKYELAIGWIHISKGWFGDQVSSIYKIEPVPEDAFTILTNNNFFKKDDEFKKGLKIRNYQWRKPGKILVGCLAMILVCASAMFLWWIKKNIFARNRKK